jgi:Methyltransferase domain
VLTSMVCRYDQFLESWYQRWTRRLNHPDTVSPDVPTSYRKLWEWAAILQALDERGYLRPGMRGMGFAVGQEPLPSVLASMGVEIVASDLHEDKSSSSWINTGQHAATLDSLFKPDMVDRATFDRLVSFNSVDMNNLDSLPDNDFNFVWSSCALEHLGTLNRGFDFVINAMRLLKPGGIAVHTTEFNVSSNDETITEGPDCIYRKCDIEKLDRHLRYARCGLERVDFDCGSHDYDLNFDTPPYFRAGSIHIKLQYESYIVTSFLLIAHKAS